MDDFDKLRPAELELFEELNKRGIRYMVVGQSAAIMQGANTSTVDIDLWFERTSDQAIGEAVSAAGGVWVSGSFGMRAPAIGKLSERIDVVTHMSGLAGFADELPNSIILDVDGTHVRVLMIERIIASKRAAGRTKDIASIPALEEALAAIRSTDPK